MDTIELAMPLDLIKSEGEQDEMRIGGYASTADRDRQGESVMQKSLDISEFVTSGFFNLDHDGSKVLGFPDGDKCRIDDRGLYVEGTLLKGVPEAESLYRAAVALRKAGTSRRLGFSVEGQVLERNGRGLITKARVYNVAVTARPVNPNCTWDALVKSFASGLDAEDLDKALDTGAYAQMDGVEAQTGGAALTKEALDMSLRNLAHIIGQDGKAAALVNELAELLRGKGDAITEPEYALYMALTRALSLEKSVRLAHDIFTNRRGNA